MKSDDSYDILYDYSIRALKERVEEKKTKGWRCLGGAFQVPHRENNQTKMYWHQTMEKKEGVL